MERKVQQVRWTEKAVLAFHLQHSESAAVRTVNEIVEKADSIIFPEQYQTDELTPQFRRMVVRGYKILYETDGLTVISVNILSTKKPEFRQ